MTWKNDQVSEKETEYLLKIAEKCLEVEGDFVELGCYRGDTSLMLAELIQTSSASTEKNLKQLYIYDSFEGLPEKTADDESVLGKDFKSGELAVTKREVKERFLRAGLKVPVIKKGWFREFTSDDLPEKIAFSFLDGDFYESIRDGLRLIEKKIVPGGVLIVHDYNNPALPGVKKAVDEWLGLFSEKISLQTFESMAIMKF